MFLAGNENANAIQMLAAAGVAEGSDVEVPDLIEPHAEELATLVPTLKKIEDILQRLDADKAPLLARFSTVFRRYLELQPESGMAEIMGFLESVERKLATVAEERSSGRAAIR